MSNQAKKLVFLERQASTVKTIKALLARFKLSQNELDRWMGYSKWSHMTSHVLNHPEKYLTEKFMAKLDKGYAAILYERGYYHIVTETVDEPLPATFRIACLPRLCKGHQEPTFFGSRTDKFCDAECKQLFLARERERKAKAKLKLKSKRKKK